MIIPPSWAGGAAFSDALDGDIMADPSARTLFSSRLGVPSEWASATQIHGNEVLEVNHPGVHGGADGLWTSVPGLPLAIFTADCFGVVIGAESAVGVAHAGWRGAVSNVVPEVVAAMVSEGHKPHRAAIGPGIGPCCFEVGREVATQFNSFTTRTTWGTESVDLVGYIRSQLSDLEIWAADRCTMHEPRWFSHRESAAPERMVTLGWI